MDVKVAPDRDRIIVVKSFFTIRNVGLLTIRPAGQFVPACQSNVLLG